MLSVQANAQTSAASIEAYLNRQATYYRFNGNVLVAERGKVVFRKPYGYADFISKRTLNDSSVFELASLSKQFTAAAILLLKEKGALTLSDSLRQYFPELPYSNISIYQLLTHTSGLPDYEAAMTEKWDPNKIAFNKDMISFLAQQKLPLLFSPGSKWLYSNTGYALLASIVEKVSGETYSGFMSRYIFKPLNMKNTRMYNTRRSLKDTIPNYAYGYVYQPFFDNYRLPDSIPQLKFVYYLDGIQGDGTVNSTVADLLLWDRALKNNLLLKESTQREMFQGHAVMDSAANVKYGYGLIISQSKFGQEISHSGGWPGYSTYMSRLVDKDQTIIILSNNQSNAQAITNGLQHILNGQTVAMPMTKGDVRLDTIELDRLTGQYKGGNLVGIQRQGTGLFRIIPGRPALKLRPASPTLFFYEDGTDRQIEFELNADQHADRFWFINHGVKTEYRKIEKE